MTGYEIVGFTRLDDVLQQLRNTGARTAFLSGGTDFINNRGGEAAELVIDLSQVADLNYIADHGAAVRIGAGTTFSTIAASPVIKAKVPALAQAARQVGSVQIRNRATIGGNIASASPAGDSLPVLAAYGAGVSTAGSAGPRLLTLAEALQGLRAKELITEVVVPTPGASRSGFVKIGSRSQVTIARLSLAVMIRYNRERRLIINGKAALGALGKMPVCPASVQKFFTQRPVNRDFADTLGRLLAATVDEAIPGRASQPYKREIVRGLAHDLSGQLFGAGSK